jgi:bacterioferritin-associated ferredoxin
MYVCVCNAVTKKTVEEAIDDGARTREEVTRTCSAGGDCGSCHRYIERMIECRAPASTERIIAPSELVRERAA